MAVQAARPGALRRLAAALALAAVAGGAGADEAMTYLDGPELGERLLHNVVRLSSEASGEHGFGLVVGADATSVLVVTARHVVAADGALPGRIALRFCAAAQAGTPVDARLLPPPAERRDDLALLRAPRPRGYTPLARALAAAPQVALRDPAWLLGHSDTCAMVPRAGAVAALRDARNNLRIELPGVLGGSSGAPLLTGRGLVALVKDSDNVSVTAHSLAHLEELLRGAGWTLAEARNIPPTDPQAAEQDLAEMLNQYLFALRDVHGLLLQPVVARKSFEDFVSRYNAALQRFRDAREKYDGTLRRRWPADVAPAWDRLRDRLWALHLNFWRLNTRAREIYETERTPAAVREQMGALEPDLSALEGEIAQFLRRLANRRTDHASSPP